VPTGSTVRIALASPDEILRGAGLALSRALSAFPGGAPEVALVVSCTVRNILLGTRAGAELEELSRGLDGSVPVGGFYSFGEIAPAGPGGPPRFHNDTLAVALLGT